MTSDGQSGSFASLSHCVLSKRSAIVSVARDLDHDLGRYVFFQLAALPKDARPAVMLQAARADVLETRKRSDGSDSAMELWQAAMTAFREQFENEHELYDAFLREPLVRGLQEHMVQLHAHSAALHDGTLNPERLRRVVQDARSVSESTRRLYNTLQELCNEAT